MPSEPGEFRGAFSSVNSNHRQARDQHGVVRSTFLNEPTAPIACRTVRLVPLRSCSFCGQAVAQRVLSSTTKNCLLTRSRYKWRWVQVGQFTAPAGVRAAIHRRAHEPITSQHADPDGDHQRRWHHQNKSVRAEQRPIQCDLWKPGAMDPGMQEEAFRSPVDFVMEHLAPRMQEYLHKSYGKNIRQR